MEEKKVEEMAMNEHLSDNWDRTAAATTTHHSTSSSSIKEQRTTHDLDTPSRTSLQEKTDGKSAATSNVKDEADINDVNHETQYLEGPKLWLVMLGLGLACLLVGLVRYSSTPSSSRREIRKYMVSRTYIVSDF